LRLVGAPSYSLTAPSNCDRVTPWGVRWLELQAMGLPHGSSNLLGGKSWGFQSVSSKVTLVGSGYGLIP